MKNQLPLISCWLAWHIAAIYFIPWVSGQSNWIQAILCLPLLPVGFLLTSYPVFNTADWIKERLGTKIEVATIFLWIALYAVYWNWVGGKSGWS